MKIFRQILIGLLLIVTMQVPAAAKAWETVRGERVAELRMVAKTSDVEVRVKKGMIVISTTHPIQIKVFTILGQLVSQENLPTGVSQLNIGTRGVFIVKVGDLTCKVAL